MITWYAWTLVLFLWAVGISRILDHYKFRPRNRTERFLENTFLGMGLTLIAWHWLVWFLTACAVLIPLFVVCFFVREINERN